MLRLATLLLTVLLTPALSAAELTAGFAQKEVTPPAGFRRAGGYSEVVGTDAKDPLQVKAIVLRQGDQATALVVFDLTGIFPELEDPIRERAERDLNIPAQAISVMATHSHGGPEYGGVLREIFHQRALRETGSDPREPTDYTAFLVERALEAMREADSRRVPVSLQAGRATVEGLAFNRRFHMTDGSVRFNPGKQNPEIVGPAGPTDPHLPYLLFRDAGQKPIGLFTEFPMHTAVHGGPQFSADFPAVLQQKLQSRFGRDFVSVFAEGTAGDTNHVNVATSEPDPTPESIGKRLADAILGSLDEAVSVPTPSLSIRTAIVPAPLKPVSPEELAAARKLLDNLDREEHEFLTTVNAWRVHYNDFYRRRDGDSLPLEIQAIALSPEVAIVTLPHEVFVEIGMAIKRGSPFRHTLVASLSNGMDFYVPTRKAFAEGSYEVTTCPLEPGCGEALIEASLRALRDLKQGQPR